MRAAAGAAPGGEAVETERVGDGGGIGGGVRYAASLLRRRVVIARSGVRDEPDPLRGRILDVGPVEERAARRAVVDEHRVPLRLAVLTDAEPPAVGSVDQMLGHAGRPRPYGVRRRSVAAPSTSASSVVPTVTATSRASVPSAAPASAS